MAAGLNTASGFTNLAFRHLDRRLPLLHQADAKHLLSTLALVHWKASSDQLGWPFVAPGLCPGQVQAAHLGFGFVETKPLKRRGTTDIYFGHNEPTGIYVTVY